MSQNSLGTPIDPKNLDQLRAKALEASRRVRTERTTLRFRRGAAPQPGDTFLFHQTAEPPVQWAVVGMDASTRDHLLAVPVDAYPQVGSHDVEIYAGDPLRAANARCHLTVSLPTQSFAPDLRAGVLDTEAFDAVDQKRRAIDAGQVEASLSEQLVDDDPDYQRWTTELRSMVDRLQRTVQQSPTPERPPDGMGIVHPMTASRPWMAPMAIAASLLVALGVWSLHERRDWQSTLEKQRQENVALHGVNADLESQLEASGNALGELREQLEILGRDVRTQLEAVSRLESETSSQKRRIRGLMQSLEAAARPVGQLAAVILNDRGRSGQAVVKLTDSTEGVLLQLEPGDPNIYPAYELRVIEESTDETLITSRALAWHRQYLGIVLPAGLLREAESDKFRLELWAEVDGQLKQVDDGYQLWVERW